MDRDFLATLIMNFFVAFGVVVGGAIVGGVGAFLIGKPPLSHINDLATGLKIWALVAAIGGTFDAISSLERGIFDGTHVDIAKTLFMIFSASCGAHSAVVILSWITQEA